MSFDDSTFLPSLVNGLQFAPPRKGSNGRETVQLISPDGPLVYQMTASVAHQFPAKDGDAYDTIELELTTAQAVWFQLLEHLVREHRPDLSLCENVRPPYRGDGNSRLRVKIPRSCKLFRCHIVDGECECTPSDVSILARGMKVTVCCTLSSLWFNKNSFGLCHYIDGLLAFPADTERPVSVLPAFKGLPAMRLV